MNVTTVPSLTLKECNALYIALNWLVDYQGMKDVDVDARALELGIPWDTWTRVLEDCTFLDKLNEMSVREGSPDACVRAYGIEEGSLIATRNVILLSGLCCIQICVMVFRSRFADVVAALTTAIVPTVYAGWVYYECATKVEGPWIGYGYVIPFVYLVGTISMFSSIIVFETFKVRREDIQSTDSVKVPLLEEKGGGPEEEDPEYQALSR